jgi:hypothetical protein
VSAIALAIVATSSKLLSFLTLISFRDLRAVCLRKSSFHNFLKIVYYNA